MENKKGKVIFKPEKVSQKKELYGRNKENDDTCDVVVWSGDSGRNKMRHCHQSHEGDASFSSLSCEAQRPRHASRRFIFSFTQKLSLQIQY